MTLSTLSLTGVGLTSLIYDKSTVVSLEFNLANCIVALVGILFATIQRRRLKRAIAQRQAMMEEHMAGLQRRLAEIKATELTCAEFMALHKQIETENDKFWANLPKLDIL